MCFRTPFHAEFHIRLSHFTNSFKKFLNNLGSQFTSDGATNGGLVSLDWPARSTGISSFEFFPNRKLNEGKGNFPEHRAQISAVKARHA